MSSHEPTKESTYADNKLRDAGDKLPQTSQHCYIGGGIIPDEYTFPSPSDTLDKLSRGKCINRIIVHTGHNPTTGEYAHWETDDEYKYRNFKYGGNMIDIYRQRPTEGTVVKCMVDIWVNGVLNHTEERIAKYIRWSSITNTAIFAFPDQDECFERVTRWCEIDKD